MNQFPLPDVLECMHFVLSSSRENKRIIRNYELDISVRFNAEAEYQRDCVKETESDAGGLKVHGCQLRSIVENEVYRKHACDEEGDGSAENDGSEITYGKSRRSVFVENAVFEHPVQRGADKGERKRQIKCEIRFLVFTEDDRRDGKEQG